MPAILVAEFDIWTPGYDGSNVSVFIAGTTTLASLFSNEALTITLPNPQQLASLTDQGGTNYGKFNQPVYTNTSYFLKIDSAEDTGIKRIPLTNIDGEDASNATVTVAGSSTPNTLAAIVGRTVYATDFGEIEVGGASGSAATNTTTIQAAIGALGGSGVVHLPQGLIRCNALSVPANVVLEGEGLNATTLQVIGAGNAFTLTGDYSGFRNMSIDGNNLTAGSRGVFALNRSFILFENFAIGNFDTGLTFKGGQNPQWQNFNINNCNTGAELHGDKDAGGTPPNTGGAFIGGRWDGGQVFACSTIGVDYKYVDALVAHIGMENVFFKSNVATALRLKGAQFNPFYNCRWDGNGTNVDISDDATILAVALRYQNKAIGLQFENGIMNGGKVQATGNAADVVFEHMKLLGVTFNLIPTLSNNIILKDCFEDSGTVITGDATHLVRQFGAEQFEVTGLTTGNAATRAWGITLDDNQCVYFEVKVIGVQRNGTNRAIYHAVLGARRAAASLNYQSETGAFTAGDILTGTTSGASARLIANSNSGATGTLSLEDIQGVFLNGEIITGSTTGSANANGAVTQGTHAVDSVGLVHLRTAYETDTAWDISFAFSTGEIAFQVQGNSSQTVDWTVQIDMLTS